MAGNNKNSSKNNKTSRQKKLFRAEEDLKKMLVEIEPFIKKDQVLEFSTKGKWIDTSIFGEQGKEVKNNLYLTF